MIESLKTYHGLEKFVHVTTPEVYGSTADLISENHPFNPSTPYAVTRAAGDMMLKAFHEKDGLPVILLEAANVLALPTAIQNNTTGDNGVYDRRSVHA